jgi:hypothetical protein
MASEQNESLLARNNKGIARKAFWYRNDVSVNLRINNSCSMIMQGNVPSSKNKQHSGQKQTASEWNELLLARNNKGTTKKSFWYQNDVSIKLTIAAAWLCRATYCQAWTTFVPRTKPHQNETSYRLHTTTRVWLKRHFDIKMTWL